MSHYEEQYRGTYNLVKEEQGLREELREDLREDLREEPVAWMYEWKDEAGIKRYKLYKTVYGKDLDVRLKLIPLYTSPPKREPLSNEQKRLEAIAIKQRKAHGIGGGE